MLGPGSVEAAKVASAARNQLPGDRFWAFHNKLLGMHGPIGKAEAMAVAKELGLDMDGSPRTWRAPTSRPGSRDHELADALQINGTPTFVVGQDLVVGAVGYDQLKSKIDSVHKCGRGDCYAEAARVCARRRRDRPRLSGVFPTTGEVCQ